MTTTTSGAIAPAVFHFNASPVSVFLKDGDPWFLARDVCPALGMTIGATRRLDEDEKGLTNLQTHGGEQEVIIISEPGLYRLAGRSNKPAAKAFIRWVAHDVLPAIRKTGSYSAIDPNPTPDDAHEYLTPQDMMTITRIVWLISHGMWFERGWVKAVWARLRSATGTKAPNRFHVRHIPIIAAELRRIFRLAESFKAAERQAGQLLVKRVLRNGEEAAPILAEAQRLMSETAAADESALNQQMERWQEAELAALTDRKPTRLCGSVVASYGEQPPKEEPSHA